MATADVHQLGERQPVQGRGGDFADAPQTFHGYWGKQQELEKFLQSYAVEKARIEARKKGFNVTEQTLQDGSIKLTVQVTGQLGGAA